MAKKKIPENDARFTALMNAVKKFYDDQGEVADKFHIKRIVLSLGGETDNPCRGKKCEKGYHPEVHIDPDTGEVSCRCVKD